MSTIKTTATTKSVQEFLDSVTSEEKKQDCQTLLTIFEEVTREKPIMWGTSIIGFGKYHYKSTKSRQEADWLKVGFAPRSSNITLYIMHGNENTKELEALGKYKAGGGCLYINKLSDIDQKVLKQMISTSYKAPRMYSV